MKKLILLFMLSACIFSGCSTTTHNIVNNVEATGINFASSKKGKDCAYNLFGLITLKNANIDDASRNASIRSLKYAEYIDSNYIIITKHCIVAYGN